MRICLVRCPSPFLIDEYVFPPLGLMSVATGLKIRGHDVTIFDETPDKITSEFLNSFDGFGFGPTIAEYGYARKLSGRIGEENPRARVVIGGPFATVNASRCVEDGFDCVVVGDGEIAAHEAFTGRKRMIYAEERPLDDYPIIDRDVINLGKYKYLLDGRLATTILTSQGCPYKCGFCSKNYNTVRFRSPWHVRKELEILRNQFGYMAVAFPEDLFVLQKERTEAICADLSRLGIIWRCLVRGDTIVRHGQEFADMMAQTGCVEVGMGVESGSDQILQTINKGEDVATIRKGIRMMKSAGIRVKGYFILGLPGENEQTLQNTRDFLEDARLDDVDIKIYQPYPATPIWRDRDRYDIYWRDMHEFEDMFYKGRFGEYRGSIRTSALSNERLHEAWMEMERRYKKIA